MHYYKISHSFSNNAKLLVTFEKVRMDNEALVQNLIFERYINVQDHPSGTLEILNYTPKTQFEKKWNDVTLQCRGLIRDKTTKKIVARGLPKFFNYSEIKNDAKYINEISKLPFEVYDKMDGSCGILYWLNNEPYIATRGSFESPQAKHASEVLHRKYKPLLGYNFDLLDRNTTLIFEIIYPENKIVVDYKDEDDIFLICAFDINTGNEVPTPDLPFPNVKKFQFSNSSENNGLIDVKEILKIQDPKNEGFVIRYSNGYRMKIKFEEYKRLHNIVTRISSVDIWQNLMDSKSFDEILEIVPDEYYDWIKNKKESIELDYQEVEMEATMMYGEVQCINRKDVAKHLQYHKYTSIVFMMLADILPRINPGVLELLPV